MVPVQAGARKGPGPSSAEGALSIASLVRYTPDRAHYRSGST
jgi:hypothetical protein